MQRVGVLTSIHPDYDARVYRHARSLVELGLAVDLIAPWPDRSPLPPGLRLLRFRRVTRRIARPVLIAARVAPLVFRGRYDLVHFHDLDLLPLMALYRLVTRRAVVYDCHENYPEEMLYRYGLGPIAARSLSLAVSVLERACARVIHFVVVVVDEQVRRFPPPRFDTVVVRNFADRELEKDRATDYGGRQPACISIASQYVDNGSLLLVDVAAIVVRRRPGVRFYIADRFPSQQLRASVLARIHEADLDENVVLIPNVAAPDIMRTLNRGTIGLALDLDVPHRRLALPIKLFEFMAAGLPIVASDLPNSRSFVAGAQCGILVRPGDAGSFADAICKLVDDPQLAQSLGANGLNAFRSELNWGAEVKKLAPLYERALARP
jgi:glycosyltransferase involved in cell wall biosynthesis